uniref:Uncharacterized protein n=2 Tax=Populus TaxID=3689 RepID=A0A4U5NA62_POPAL|nr:hypothetical protein D5086_0000273690 [Populus alba]
MEDIFNVFKEGLGLCLRRRGVCGRRGMLGFSMTLFISLALTVVSPADIQPDYKLKAGNIVCSLGRGEDGQLGHGYGCLPDSWGRNQNGQLGLGTTEGSLVPKKIQGFQALRFAGSSDPKKKKNCIG